MEIITLQTYKVGDTIHFDSGKLNKRITIISYSHTTNEIGELVQQPIPIKKVWAFLEPIRRYQQIEGQRLSNEITYKILTRYHKEITIASTQL